jgi:uracil-DNA glycosylase family 4
MTRLAHPITGQPFASPVPPGTGWPEDPADVSTPVASTALEVVELAQSAGSLAEVGARVSVCRACPRLVGWREQVAAEKRRAFADQPYWGRPVPGFGSATPRVIVVGLAPAANGANRTGRMFTGDRSGDWLYASMHRVGLARIPTSEHAGDGQELPQTRLVAPVRCAPPENKPTPAERDACAGWLDAELALVLPTVRVVVCLGSYGWDAALRGLARQGLELPRPRPAFGHGARLDLGRLLVLGCYHPSQQNTFTGKLTESMLDAVLGEAAQLAGVRQDSSGGTSPA